MRTKANYDRATELYKEKLLAKQDFDQKKAEYDTAVAAIGEAEARLCSGQGARGPVAPAAGFRAKADRTNARRTWIATRTSSQNYYVMRRSMAS